MDNIIHGTNIMSTRNFTDSEEVEIAKLYTIGGFGIKEIKRAYGYKHHISFSNALKRQGVTIRSNHENNRLYSVNHNFFDVIDTEEKAYFLGWIYADGCVYNRTLSIGIKREDRNMLEKFKQAIDSEHPITDSLVGDGTSNNKHKQSGIFITHKDLAKRLKDLGIIPRRGKPEKSTSQIPDHLLHHWIRGLVDGDGSFHSYKPGFSLVGSKPLLDFIRKTFANEIGLNPDIKIYKHPTAKIHSLIYMGRPQCLKIAEWLYRDATIWMPRKRDIVENYPAPTKRERNPKGQYK